MRADQTQEVRGINDTKLCKLTKQPYATIKYKPLTTRGLNMT